MLNTLKFNILSFIVEISHVSLFLCILGVRVFIFGLLDPNTQWRGCMESKRKKHKKCIVMGCNSCIGVHAFACVITVYAHESLSCKNEIKCDAQVKKKGLHTKIYCGAKKSHNDQ